MNFQNQIDWLQLRNEDMLEGVTAPDPLDLETLKSQIVFRCGLLIPAYSEPEIQKTAITQFFKREQWNIKHLINIILAEYSPIENTNRYSEHTTKEAGVGSSTHSGTDARNITNSGSDQREIQLSGMDQRDIQESGSTTDTKEISAYNTSGYQADNKETVDHGKKTDDDITYGKKTEDDITYGKQTQDNLTHGLKITDEKSGETSYTEHTHGNIGVTTNQEMIRQELELLEAFDIYDWIAAKVEKELFLQIY